jgi:glycine/D-amino acid oxidase-like deaminating enzyme
VNGAEAGVAFDTLTIDIPVYLPYLLSRFLAAGGQITRGSVRHINEVIEGGLNGQTASPSPTQASVDAVVVCTALGTRSLGGVEDQNVFPLRGQTVIVRAPWIRFGRSMFGADGSITYIIPRRGGDVCILPGLISAFS